jgi:hypothetical protein
MMSAGTIGTSAAPRASSYLFQRPNFARSGRGEELCLTLIVKKVSREGKMRLHFNNREALG